MRVEAPLDAELTRELFEFWVSIFGEPLDLPPDVFLGAEVEQNGNTVYLTRRDDGRLAGTCVGWFMTVQLRWPSEARGVACLI